MDKFVALRIFFLVFFVIACGEAPQTTEKEDPAAKAASLAQTKASEAIAEEARRNRARLVNELKEELDLAVSTPDLTDWSREVKGEKPISIAVCKSEVRWRKVSHLERLVQTDSTGNGSLGEEVGTTPAEVQKLLQAEAVRSSKQLLDAVKEGVSIPCPLRDGELGDEDFRRFQAVDWAVDRMEKNGVKPEDVGYTKKSIRDLHLSAAKNAIASIRKNPYEGEYTLYQLLTFWNYSAADLGITEEEAEKARNHTSEGS